MPVEQKNLKDVKVGDKILIHAWVDVASIEPAGRGGSELLHVKGTFDWTAHQYVGLSVIPKVDSQEERTKVIEELERLVGRLKAL